MAFQPAEGEIVGGDFHECLAFEDRTVLVIGDVTGHGISAALVMAMLFGALREAARYSRHPCQMLGDMHDILAELGDSAGGPRLFSATAFIGVLPHDGRLLFASAGHPPPLLLHGHHESPTPIRLGPVLPPLGMSAAEACREEVAQMAPGDRLLLYTDGVLAEGASPESLCSLVPVVESRSPERFVQRLVHQGRDDDRTAVLLTFRGPGGC